MLALRTTVLLSSLALATSCTEPDAPAKTVPVSAEATQPTASPDDALAEAERALALAEPEGKGPTVTAVKKSQEAVNKLPDKPDAWVKLAEAWLHHARVTRDGLDWQRADVAAQAALQKNPDLLPAKNLSALVLLHGHRFRDAKTIAEEILKREPRNAMALGTLSDAELELGNLDAAVSAAQRMIDIKPNLPSYSRTAWLRWLRGDVAGALDAWRLAVDAGRGSLPEPTAFALTEAANVFWHRGDLDGADKGLDMALGVMPGYGPALTTKARIALARGDAAKAATFAKQALVFEELLPVARLLEEAHRAAGDEAAANEARAVVERLGKTDPRAFALYRAVYKRDLDAAEKEIARERRTGGGPYTLDAHAWVLHRAGKSKAALPLVEQVVALGTPDPRLLFHAGAVRMAAGKEDEGEALIKKALELNKAFDPVEADEARALLK